MYNNSPLNCLAGASALPPSAVRGICFVSMQERRERGEQRLSLRRRNRGALPLALAPWRGGGRAPP